MSYPPSIPSAAIAHPRRFRRVAHWIARRLEPPSSLYRKQGFTAGSSWAGTGALAASGAIGLYILVMSGLLWRADFTLALGWAVFSLIGVMVLFWPFLLSYYVYAGAGSRPVGRVRTPAHRRARIRGAWYGATFHVAAHSLVMHMLGAEVISTALLAPLVVGGIWGSWLPAAITQDP